MLEKNGIWSVFCGKTSTFLYCLLRGKKKPQKAFTLTEMLIALVVVAVLAVLILPVVTTRAQNKSFALSYEAQVKQMLNSLTGLHVMENKTDFRDTMMYIEHETEDYTNSSGAYINKYMKVSKYCKNSPGDCFAQKYYEYKGNDREQFDASVIKGACALLKNGASICLKPQVKAETGGVSEISGWLDLNGPKGPNVYGRDLRTFRINLSDRVAYSEEDPLDVIMPDNTGECIGSSCQVPDACIDAPSSQECCMKKVISAAGDPCCPWFTAEGSAYHDICWGAQEEPKDPSCKDHAIEGPEDSCCIQKGGTVQDPNCCSDSDSSDYCCATRNAGTKACCDKGIAAGTIILNEKHACCQNVEIAAAHPQECVNPCKLDEMNNKDLTTGGDSNAWRKGKSLAYSEDGSYCCDYYSRRKEILKIGSNDGYGPEDGCCMFKNNYDDKTNPVSASHCCRLQKFPAVNHEELDKLCCEWRFTKADLNGKSWLKTHSYILSTDDSASADESLDYDKRKFDTCCSYAMSKIAKMNSDGTWDVTTGDGIWADANTQAKVWQNCCSVGSMLSSGKAGESDAVAKTDWTYQSKDNGLINLSAECCHFLVNNGSETDGFGRPGLRELNPKTNAYGLLRNACCGYDEFKDYPECCSASIDGLNVFRKSDDQWREVCCMPGAGIPNGTYKDDETTASGPSIKCCLDAGPKVANEGKKWFWSQSAQFISAGNNRLSGCCSQGNSNAEDGAALKTHDKWLVNCCYSRYKSYKESTEEASRIPDYASDSDYVKGCCSDSTEYPAKEEKSESWAKGDDSDHNEECCLAYGSANDTHSRNDQRWWERCCQKDKTNSVTPHEFHFRDAGCCRNVNWVEDFTDGKDESCCKYGIENKSGKTLRELNDRFWYSNCCNYDTQYSGAVSEGKTGYAVYRRDCCYHGEESSATLDGTRYSEYGVINDGKTSPKQQTFTAEDKFNKYCCDPDIATADEAEESDYTGAPSNRCCSAFLENDGMINDWDSNKLKEAYRGRCCRHYAGMRDSIVDLNCNELWICQANGKNSTDPDNNPGYGLPTCCSTLKANNSHDIWRGACCDFPADYKSNADYREVCCAEDPTTDYTRVNRKNGSQVGLDNNKEYCCKPNIVADGGVPSTSCCRHFKDKDNYKIGNGPQGEELSEDYKIECCRQSSGEVNSTTDYCPDCDIRWKAGIKYEYTPDDYSDTAWKHYNFSGCCTNKGIYDTYGDKQIWLDNCCNHVGSTIKNVNDWYKSHVTYRKYCCGPAKPCEGEGCITPVGCGEPSTTGATSACCTEWANNSKLTAGTDVTNKCCEDSTFKSGHTTLCGGGSGGGCGSPDPTKATNACCTEWKDKLSEESNAYAKSACCAIPEFNGQNSILCSACGTPNVAGATAACCESWDKYLSTNGEVKAACCAIEAYKNNHTSFCGNESCGEPTAAPGTAKCCQEWKDAGKIGPDKTGDAKNSWLSCCGNDYDPTFFNANKDFCCQYTVNFDWELKAYVDNSNNGALKVALTSSGKADGKQLKVTEINYVCSGTNTVSGTTGNITTLVGQTAYSLGANCSGLSPSITHAKVYYGNTQLQPSSYFKGHYSQGYFGNRCSSGDCSGSDCNEGETCTSKDWSLTGEDYDSHGSVMLYLSGDVDASGQVKIACNMCKGNIISGENCGHVKYQVKAFGNWSIPTNGVKKQQIMGCDPEGEYKWNYAVNFVEFQGVTVKNKGNTIYTYSSAPASSYSGTYQEGGDTCNKGNGTYKPTTNAECPNNPSMSSASAACCTKWGENSIASTAATQQTTANVKTVCCSAWGQDASHKTFCCSDPAFRSNNPTFCSGSATTNCDVTVKWNVVPVGYDIDSNTFYYTAKQVEKSYTCADGGPMPDDELARHLPTLVSVTANFSGSNSSYISYGDNVVSRDILNLYNNGLMSFTQDIEYGTTMSLPGTWIYYGFYNMSCVVNTFGGTNYVCSGQRTHSVVLNRSASSSLMQRVIAKFRDFTRIIILKADNVVASVRTKVDEKIAKIHQARREKELAKYKDVTGTTAIAADESGQEVTMVVTDQENKTGVTNSDIHCCVPEHENPTKECCEAFKKNIVNGREFNDFEPTPNPLSHAYKLRCCDLYNVCPTVKECTPGDEENNIALDNCRVREETNDPTKWSIPECCACLNDRRVDDIDWKKTCCPYVKGTDSESLDDIRSKTSTKIWLKSDAEYREKCCIAGSNGSDGSIYSTKSNDQDERCCNYSAAANANSFCCAKKQKAKNSTGTAVAWEITKDGKEDYKSSPFRNACCMSVGDQYCTCSSLYDKYPNPSTLNSKLGSSGFNKVTCCTDLNTYANKTGTDLWKKACCPVAKDNTSTVIGTDSQFRSLCCDSSKYSCIYQYNNSCSADKDNKSTNDGKDWRCCTLPSGNMPPSPNERKGKDNWFCCESLPTVTTRNIPHSDALRNASCCKSEGIRHGKIADPQCCTYNSSNEITDQCCTWRRDAVNAESKWIPWEGTLADDSYRNSCCTKFKGSDSSKKFCTCDYNYQNNTSHLTGECCSYLHGGCNSAPPHHSEDNWRKNCCSKTVPGSSLLGKDQWQPDCCSSKVSGYYDNGSTGCCTWRRDNNKFDRSKDAFNDASATDGCCNWWNSNDQTTYKERCCHKNKSDESCCTYMYDKNFKSPFYEGSPCCQHSKFKDDDRCLDKCTHYRLGHSYYYSSSGYTTLSDSDKDACCKLAFSNSAMYNQNSSFWIESCCTRASGSSFVVSADEKRCCDKRTRGDVYGGKTVYYYSASSFNNGCTWQSSDCSAYKYIGVCSSATCNYGDSSDYNDYCCNKQFSKTKLNNGSNNSAKSGCCALSSFYDKCFCECGTSSDPTTSSYYCCDCRWSSLTSGQKSTCCDLSSIREDYPGTCCGSSVSSSKVSKECCNYWSVSKIKKDSSVLDGCCGYSGFYNSNKNLCNCGPEYSSSYASKTCCDFWNVKSGSCEQYYYEDVSASASCSVDSSTGSVKCSLSVSPNSSHISFYARAKMRLSCKSGLSETYKKECKDNISGKTSWYYGSLTLSGNGDWGEIDSANSYDYNAEMEAEFTSCKLKVDGYTQDEDDGSSCSVSGTYKVEK